MIDMLQHAATPDTPAVDSQKLIDNAAQPSGDYTPVFGDRVRMVI